MKNQYRFFEKDYKDLKHQLINVLRLKVGDKFTLIKDEKEFLCEICENSYSIIKEITVNREPNIDLTLCVGVLKKDKLEYVFQKCVEVGVNHFILFNGHNSVKKMDNETFIKVLPRYEKIIEEACEQSLRLKKPNIEFCDFKNIDFSIYDKIFITDTEGISLKNSLNNKKKILLIIGPEGGFSQEEFDYIKEKGGELISFGPRIMRSETSCVVISGSIINFYEL